MVQSLVFGVGMPVADCDLVLVEEGKVQYCWPTVVHWDGSEYIGGVCEAKICYIADLDQVLGPLGWLAAGFPSGVVFVHVTCD